MFPYHPVYLTSSWHAQHSFLHFAAEIKLVFVIVMWPSWAERAGTGWLALFKDCPCSSLLDAPDLVCRDQP